MSRNRRLGAPCRWKAIGSLFVGAVGFSFASAPVAIDGSGSAVRVAASSEEIRFVALGFGTGGNRVRADCRRRGKPDTEGGKASLRPRK